MKQFFWYSLLCWAVGAMAYFVPAYAATVGPEGKSTDNQFWTGLSSFTVVVLAHHAMVMIYTRNWSCFIAFFYILSLLMGPLVMYLADGSG